jgi:L-iditol 2-dehydrogenase/D-xylulose reductase
MGSNMTVPVPLFDVINKQLLVTGSFRYGAGDYELAISLVERGLVKLAPLVTQRFDFKDALEAFETTRKGKDEDGQVCPFCFPDWVTSCIGFVVQTCKRHFVQQTNQSFR